MKKYKKLVVVVPLTGMLMSGTGVLGGATSAHADGIKIDGMGHGPITGGGEIYSDSALLDIYINHLNEGKYGNWRDGGTVGGLIDVNGMPADGKARAMSKYYLISQDQIPAVMEKIKNTDQLELLDLLKALTPGTDVYSDIQKHKYLNVDTDKKTHINIDKSEVIGSPLAVPQTVKNETNQEGTATAPSISKKFTSTISRTDTHSTTLGMKQTIKGGIDFLGIAEGDFSQEFSESYTYSNASQKLTSEETTITSGPLTIKTQPHSAYEFDIIYQQTKNSGTVTGTSRLGGGYSLSVPAAGDYVGPSYFDISIYKKMKVIQDLYPTLWNVLKEKGIDVNDTTQEVNYTGGIGFEGITGAKIDVTAKNLATGEVINRLITPTPIKPGTNMNITEQLQGTIQSIVSQ
ncbi:ETX/MTX2 family pore-forming toxin [Bacillus cereus]